MTGQPEADLPFTRYFKLVCCPLCGSSEGEIKYPIDAHYLYSHTRVDVSGYQIGVAVCSKCEHQFIQPCPTRDFLTLFYASYMSAAKSGFYKARQAGAIPDVFRLYYSPWLDEIRKMQEAAKPTLLDIGCGLGMFLRLAREKGFHVVGIEPNAEAVERLAKVFSITAYNSLLEDYLPKEKFDVVTMWDLLEHLAEPKVAIEKVFSMLNHGGLLALEIPIRDSLLHWAAKGLFWASFGKVRRPLFLTYGVHHLQYFSEGAVVSFLVDQGFEVIRSRRTETSLDALRKKSGGIKSVLYNLSLNVLFVVARLIRRQNKLVIIARKGAN